MGPLLRIDGPACPSCGCRDSEKIERRPRETKPGPKKTEESWFAKQTSQGDRRLCRYCGREFTAADAEEMVPYGTTTCPACKSTNVEVIRTAKPIRYHKCRDCGNHFKSYQGATDEQSQRTKTTGDQRPGRTEGRRPAP